MYKYVHEHFEQAFNAVSASAAALKRPGAPFFGQGFLWARKENELAHAESGRNFFACYLFIDDDFAAGSRSHSALEQTYVAACNDPGHVSIAAAERSIGFRPFLPLGAGALADKVPALGEGQPESLELSEQHAFSQRK